MMPMVHHAKSILRHQADQKVGSICSRQVWCVAETAGTYSGVLAERAAIGAPAIDSVAELAPEENSDMGSLTGWQALADQVFPPAHASCP